MIASLHIQNIALIEELHLELSEGLNILSGETGAGKSIIIDSLNFVLGDRADKSLIRHGQKKSSVQVVFTNDNDGEVLAILEECGVDEDDYIIVKRTMSDNGRGECRVNGSIINLSQLKKLVVRLVDIHSQHEHQALLNESNHIAILDKYIVGMQDAKAEYLSHFHTYKKSVTELKSYKDSDARARQIDILSFQLAEIDKINMQDGEEEKLIADRAKYLNAQKIIDGLNSAIELLNGDEMGAIASIHTAKRHLGAISKYDDSLTELVDRLDSAKIELGDIAETLESQVDDCNINPAEYERIEERLADIRKLKRKYGSSLQEISAFYSATSDELNKLTTAEERIEELSDIIEIEGSKVVKFAKKLHKMRVDGGVKFSEGIANNLHELGMASSTFAVEANFPEDDMILNKCQIDGADIVTFRISPNKGEPLKSLAKIASGGEMSRFMLGLKNITAELEGIDTLVFDEIDTGISGKIAMVVACKMYNIATNRQVIAVTHLPQLASMADTHYRIHKEEIGEKTLTFISKLSEDECLKEIMRLAGSTEGSQIGLESAKELRAYSNAYKQSVKK
ncbi:MAG: DNA repair protein RecN [Bacillota bacterium]